MGTPDIAASPLIRATIPIAPYASITTMPFSTRAG
jgi:hypothetical protein